MSDSKNKKDAFLKKLKTACKNCKNFESIKVYYRNIVRLYKLTNSDDVVPPQKQSWVNEKNLITAYEKQPLKVRRHLSVAAVKFLQMLGKKHDAWFKRMTEDSIEYDKHRSKNIKSDSEKLNWPKHGYKSIRKAANEFWRRNKFTILDGEPNKRKLYLYTQYISIRMFSEIPFRNTFSDFYIVSRKGKNYVHVPKKGSVILHVRDYKNSDRLGEKKIVLSRGLTTQVRKFLKYREKVLNDSNNFFLNSLNGEKLSRSALGKMVQRILKRLLHKNIGSRLIRVLAATASKKEIEAVTKLSNSLLHTTKQSKQYVRKD